MASVRLSIRIETEPCYDLLEDWASIGHALATRHGDVFRALDRRMAEIEEGEIGQPVIHDLGDGLLIVTPPPEMVAVVAEARRLGVI